MADLIKGGNAPIATRTPRASVVWSAAGDAAADLDVAAFLLRGDGRVGGDADMIFFNNPATRGVALGPVAQRSEDGFATHLAFDLPALAATVERIAVTATLPPGVAFAAMPSIRIAIADGAETIAFDVPTSGMGEQALILGEIYRRNEAWKFRAIGQGYVGGLEPLAKSFGVDVAASEPAASPTPPPPKPVNLSKISLTKEAPKIDLSKKAATFGEIRLNLNWSRGGSAPRSGGFAGLFGGGTRASAIDLDLGCLFELSSGRKGVVQALGDAFGTYEAPPYIQLASDDRTGASQDGEWMRINGRHWSEIRRVLVFASIYSGVPNWAATDGVATILIPDQPPVEVRLTEGRRGMTACAMALIENVGTTMRITRLDTYFDAVDAMDRAYSWGLRWVTGSKD